MKAYKIEILIINHEELSQEEIESVIENTIYSNRCISPEIWGIKEIDIGEWSDDHPLNLPEFKYSYYSRHIK